jgi:hypothetical protein
LKKAVWFLDRLPLAFIVKRQTDDIMIKEFLLHKDKKENKENPAHKSKSVAALPFNRPFASTHMLFSRCT